jgi:hypothetical protein
MLTPVKTTHTAVPNDVKAVTLKLFAYCRAHDWSGGLMTPLMPLHDVAPSQFPAFKILTQFLKSEISWRLFGIPKRNPRR